MLGVALGLTLALCGGLDDTTAPAGAWSPDGKWFAYLTRSGATDSLIAPGEFLRRRPLVSFDQELQGSTRLMAATSVWVSRPDQPRSLPLLVSEGLVSPPCWTADGRSLIVLRPIIRAGRVSRVETLRLQPGSPPRILFAEEVDLPIDQVARLLSEVPACGSDGGYAVVPGFLRPGLVVLRLSDGVAVRRFEGMVMGAWSPDGFRLAMLKPGEPTTLHLVEVRNGEPRRLAEIGRADQSPVWSSDGRWIYTTINRASVGFGLAKTDDFDLARLSTITGQPDSLLGRETERAMPGEAPARSVSFAIDRDGENLFYGIVRVGSPFSVTWYRPREGFFFKRFPIVDFMLPATGLNLSPGGRFLAARIGNSGISTAPVIFDLDKSTAIPMVPDDRSRAEWISLLARACRFVIDGHREGRLRQAALDPHPASPLPLPAEFAENSEEMMRLRRIAKLGRGVCRRDTTSPATTGPLVGILDEADLCFSYLAGEFVAARNALERLEAEPRDAEDRLTLLGLRAQIALAAAEFDSFDETMKLLERIESRRPREVVILGESYRLYPVRPEPPRWTDSLRLAKSRMEADDDAKPGRSAVDPLAPRTRIDGLVPRIPVPFDPFDR